VTDLSAREVSEVFEIRAGLLEIVARKFATVRDPALLALLRGDVARLQKLAATKDDQGAYPETSHRMPILAVRAGDNQRLTEDAGVAVVAAIALRQVEPFQRGATASIWSEALSVLKAGDVDGYARPVRLRVEESGTRLRGSLKPPRMRRRPLPRPGSLRKLPHDRTANSQRPCTR
jgi:DNA-binding GntR family transcriptional regulator